MKRKFPFWFLATVLPLFVASGIVIALLSRYNHRFFVTGLVLFAAALLLSLATFLLMRKNMLHVIAKLNDGINTTERESMYLLPSPTVIIDPNGLIVWYNQFFNDYIMNGKDSFGVQLTEIVAIDMDQLLAHGSMLVTMHDRTYDVHVTPKETGHAPLTTLCFTDVTDFVILQHQFADTRPSVLLLVVDNYEDVLQAAKESEKAAVFAAVEQMLDRFMANTNGILRKLANDRFLAILEEQDLQAIMKEKFQILDAARTIMVGERYNITLSIGVGHGAISLEESEAFAKQSLDMALGRGGDQAAVKTESGFKFFGGVSKGVEKKSRAKTRIIANALQELIHTCDNVLIMGHRIGDLDSVGSAVGLAKTIALNDKEVSVVVNTEKTLAGSLISRIQQIDPDLFVSIPTALAQCNENTLLIIVDTHSKDFLESVDLYQKAKHVVVIDHHRKTVNFIDNAVIFYHEPYASSASEMITELMQYFKCNAPLPAAYANALLAGIILDTKSFIMRTGVRTFEAAAFLRKIGADTVSVKTLFASSIETYRRKSALVASAEIFRRCAIAVSEQETEDSMLISPQAADELLSIEDVDASFVIFRANGKIGISARSMGALNVQVIMEKLGGGGHQTMAATQIPDINAAQAKEMLLHVLAEE